MYRFRTIFSNCGKHIWSLNVCDEDGNTRGSCVSFSGQIGASIVGSEGASTLKTVKGEPVVEYASNSGVWDPYVGNPYAKDEAHARQARRSGGKGVVNRSQTYKGLITSIINSYLHDPCSDSLFMYATAAQSMWLHPYRGGVIFQWFRLVGIIWTPRIIVLSKKIG